MLHSTNGETIENLNGILRHEDSLTRMKWGFILIFLLYYIFDLCSIYVEAEVQAFVPLINME